MVISKVEAIALNRRYRQLAVWRIEDDALILIECATGQEIRLARFSGPIVGS